MFEAGRASYQLFPRMASPKAPLHDNVEETGCTLERGGLSVFEPF